MIDSMYQDRINANLDDRVRRPSPTPPAAAGLWANFSGGFGGLVAGGFNAAAGEADQVGGFGQVSAAGGAMSGGGMFSLQSDAEAAQTVAAHNKLMTEGVDMSSAAGDRFRAKAKAFMPDPQTTGQAGQILAGLGDFGSQAMAAGLGGPAGLISLGVNRGLQRSDELKQQGVDFNTRTAVGAVSGTTDAASLLLPLSGATALLRAGKGAAGGVASSVVATEAQKLILEHQGYGAIASTMDPFDPVSLALSALVPAGFGAAFGHAAKAPGMARAEPTPSDFALSPAEQAHSDAAEAASIDTDIASLHTEIAKQKDAGSIAVLQTELDRLTKQKQAGVGRALAQDPANVDAARTLHAADAIDASRLTPDHDLAGYTAHTQAVESAADSIARGQPVDVSGILGDRPLDDARTNAMRDQLTDTSSLLPAADDEHIGQLAPEAQGRLRGMYADAAREKGGFDATLGRIAEDVGGRAMTPPLKGTARAVEKIGSDYAGDPSRVKDLLRATIEVDSAEAAQRAIAAIHAKYDVQPGHRNLLMEGTEPLPGGYRDAKLNVSVNGHIAEIQVNLPEMLAAKKSAHKLYEESRTLRAEVDAQPFGEHSEAKLARIEVLNAKMREAYDAAWAEATKVRNSDSPMGLPLRSAEAELKTRGGETSQAAETGAPLTAAQDTGMPSTSKNRAPGSNLAGRESGADFIGTSNESLHLDALSRAAADLALQNPDMLVHLDGMDAPMRVADLLEQVAADAAAEKQDASLVQVAAQCALSSGST